MDNSETLATLRTEPRQSKTNKGTTHKTRKMNNTDLTKFAKKGII